MQRATAILLYSAVAPLLVIYFFVAYVLGTVAALLIWPRTWLAGQMFWSCPFVPMVFKKQGARGKLLRIGFEVSYTLNVVKRLVTLPLRRALPSFHITGFPVSLTQPVCRYGETSRNSVLEGYTRGGI